jgi:hypothetical protein
MRRWPDVVVGPQPFHIDSFAPARCTPPAVLEEAVRRNRSLQLRVADLITGVAGSMSFVFIHAALFAAWMLFLEKSPWPALTLVVSLEAISLLEVQVLRLRGR